MDRARRFDLRALSERLNRQLWKRACAAYGDATLRRREQLAHLGDKRGVEDDGRLLLPHDDAVIQAVDGVVASGGLGSLLLIPLLAHGVIARQELDGRAPERLARRGPAHASFLESALGPHGTELGSLLVRAIRRAADGHVTSEHMHSTVWWVDCATGVGGESASLIVADAMLELAVHTVNSGVAQGHDARDVVHAMYGTGRQDAVNYVDEIGGERIVGGFLASVMDSSADLSEAHYVGDVVHYLNRSVPVARAVLEWGTRLALESFELITHHATLGGLVRDLAAGNEERVEDLREDVWLYDEDLEDHDIVTLVAVCWRCAAEGREPDDSDVAGLVLRDGLSTYDLTRSPRDLEVGPLLSGLATLFAWYGSETRRSGAELLVDLGRR